MTTRELEHLRLRAHDLREVAAAIDDARTYQAPPGMAGSVARAINPTEQAEQLVRSLKLRGLVVIREADL